MACSIKCSICSKVVYEGIIWDFAALPISLSCVLCLARLFSNFCRSEFLGRLVRMHVPGLPPRVLHLVDMGQLKIYLGNILPTDWCYWSRHHVDLVFPWHFWGFHLLPTLQLCFQLLHIPMVMDRNSQVGDVKAKVKWKYPFPILLNHHSFLPQSPSCSQFWILLSSIWITKTFPWKVHLLWLVGDHGEPGLQWGEGSAPHWLRKALVLCAAGMKAVLHTDSESPCTLCCFCVNWWWPLPWAGEMFALALSCLWYMTFAHHLSLPGSYN